MAIKDLGKITVIPIFTNGPPGREKKFSGKVEQSINYNGIIQSGREVTADEYFERYINKVKWVKVGDKMKFPIEW